MKIEWKRGSQIDDSLIERVEKFFAINLPEDFKIIVKNNNNGRPSVTTFDTQMSKEHVFKKLLSFKEEDLETVYKSKKVLEQVDNSLFPIANDPFGNLICYKDEKLVYWLHEDNSVQFIANSFTQFLSKLY